jgi:glycerol-3-phosphate acyltransferase PlsY
MNLLWWLIFLAGGYLFGSISFARIVTKIVSPQSDLNSVTLPNESTGEPFTLKTVGATTASVKLGPKYGGLIGILDILKGFVPTLVVKLIFPEQYYFLFVGLGIVIGHIWPLYYKFRGGGGLSATLGALLATAPIGILICVLIGFVIGMPIMKNIAVAVLSGPTLFIIWSAIFIRDWYIIIFAVLFNIVLIVAVIPDVVPALKARKEGKEFDMYSTMDSIPMGKMMKKMMEKMGLSRDDETESK